MIARRPVLPNRRRLALLCFVASIAAIDVAAQDLGEILHRSAVMYGQDRFDESVTLLAEAGATASDGRDRAQIADRLTQMGLGEYAIDNMRNAYVAFREALKINPANQTATFMFLRIRTDMDPATLTNAVQPASPARGNDAQNGATRGRVSATPNDLAQIESSLAEGVAEIERLREAFVSGQAQVEQMMAATEDALATQSEDAVVLDVLGQKIDDIAEREATRFEHREQQTLDIVSMLQSLDTGIGAVDATVGRTVSAMRIVAAIAIALLSFFAVPAVIRAVRRRHVTRSVSPQRTPILTPPPQMRAALPPLLDKLTLAHAMEQLPSVSHEEARRYFDPLSEQIERLLAKLGDALRGRDQSRLVAQLSSAVAYRLGLSPEESDQVFKGAIVHDVGYLVIDRRELHHILDKSEINEDDAALLRRHVVLGPNYFDNRSLSAHLRDAMMYHHEYVDGSGYPQGLKGSEIPLIARIICGSETFVDVLSRQLPFDEISVSMAIAEFEKIANGKLDGDVVRALADVVEGALHAPARVE